MASVNQVLEEGFDLIKRNYVKFLILYILIVIFFVVIVAIGLGALFLAGALSFLNPATASYTALPAIAFFVIVLVGVIFFVEPIWIGAYYSMALQGLKGEISVTYAINQAVKKYVPLLSTFAIESLIFVAIDALIFSPLLFALPGFLSVIKSNPNLIRSGFGAAGVFLNFLSFAILLMFIYLAVTAVLVPILFEAVPLVMIEGTGGIKAIEESIDIGKKRFWNILGLIVLLILIILGIGIAQGVITAFVKFLDQIVGSVFDFILSILVSAFISAWSSSLPIIFYRDYLGKGKKSR